MFWYPQGVAVDARGSVYVADSSNNLVRKIAAGGQVSTLAGGGIVGKAASGCADGVGVSATFNNPIGIAVDTWGSVFVADTFNQLIRKITTAGVVSTVAGGGSAGGTAPGYSDGMGAGALFTAPRGIAVNAVGSVFVADTENHLVRKGEVFLALPACDATWRHVAVTYAHSPSLSVLSAFLDGTLVALQASVSALITLPAASSSTLRVGWSGDLSSNAGSLFSGSLADLRIYNRTLAPSEVVALSQPSAASFVGARLVAASPPAAGASSYLFSCAAGSAGPSSLLVKSPVDNSWAWAAAPSCAVCAAGTAAQPGAATCSLCSPGTYSLSGTSSCLPCPAGTYGSSAGLATAACSGACATCAAGSTGPSFSPPSAPLACSPAGSRAIPDAFGLQIWPAAHPANARRVDLLVAPLALCQQMRGASAADCAAAGASVVGADGATRYVVGTAAELNVEPAESMTCAAGS